MNFFPAQYLQETVAWTQENFSLRIPLNVSYELLEELLAQKLEILISESFQQFILILYRIDIPENRVKSILESAAASGEDPYKPIAALIIERQLQKVISRAKYKQDIPPDDEEKW